MKYLKNFNIFQINEIGEANIPPYDLIDFGIDVYDDDSYNYQARFVTDSGNKYIVSANGDYKTEYNFERLGFNTTELPAKKVTNSGDRMIYYFDIEFYTPNTTDNHYSAIINKGENYRIMSTVVEFVGKVIKEESDTAIFQFLGTRKEHESGYEPTIRTKYYIKYMQNFLHDIGMKYQLSGNRVIFYKQTKNI